MRARVVKHADSRHWGCQSDSSMRHNKNAIGKKATGYHFMKSTSLEATQSPVSGFCCAQTRVYDAGFFFGWIEIAYR